jgi:hypothetical protein
LTVGLGVLLTALLSRWAGGANHIQKRGQIESLNNDLKNRMQVGQMGEEVESLNAEKFPGRFKTKFGSEASGWSKKSARHKEKQAGLSKTVGCPEAKRSWK